MPLDPALPARRRNLMLAESRARRVLRVGAEAGDSTEGRGPSSIPAIELDGNGDLPAAEGEAAAGVALPGVSPGDPAYVFFTSGTSGVPKAVLGAHRGLSHFLEWERNTFEVGPGDRCSNLTGLSFDPVLREIFLPLTSGAVLHIPDSAFEAGSEGVLSWLDRERITILHTVPSVAQSWLADSRPGVRLSSLRWALFAGEPLTDSLVRRWRSAFPAAGRIVNLYGPTETTLAKCFFIVPEEPRPGIQPVGEALPQTQALVLRDGWERCGIGEMGEIVLRTPFASLGYINASREQQERFVRNPFRRDGAAQDADVVYRTGDRGRYGMDGSLHIHGRLDDQVKVRGIRIEPAEVASVLSSHPQVSSCAVVAGLGESGETELAAYVVRASSSQTRDISTELRRHVLARLPAVMIPSTFTFLERLPLTANGKLDRAALPQPAKRVPGAEGSSAVSSSRDRRKPTADEQTLIDVWGALLGVENIGPDDDFYALGGHSLNAAQAMSKARAAFGVDLPVRMIFEHPTISALAAAIQRRRQSVPAQDSRRARNPRNGPAPAPAPPRPTSIPRRTDPAAPAPLSFAQQRLWVLDRLDPGRSTYNVPRAFRLRGALDVQALGRAFEAIQDRHEVLRTVFVMKDGAPVATPEGRPPSPLRVVDLGSLAAAVRESEARRILEEDAAAPFDLGRGPLVRATLLRLDESDAILLVNIHHIAFDGWSAGVLDRELEALYETSQSGRDPSSALPELPIQYADYAVWQRRWLPGNVLDEQLAYWKRRSRRSAGARPSGRQPRPSVQTRGATRTHHPMAGRGLDPRARTP